MRKGCKSDDGIKEEEVGGVETAAGACSETTCSAVDWGFGDGVVDATIADRCCAWGWDS